MKTQNELIESAIAKLSHESWDDEAAAVRGLKAAARKILAKLDHPTASVTQWDVDELRAAIEGAP